MTIEAILEEIRSLPTSDRERLFSLIADTFVQNNDQSSSKKRSITELRGLGKEIWQGIDAQEYVDQLRSEWDHRQ